jgi:16S rRNA (cytidine1402-2'-O)-methyltransferase
MRSMPRAERGRLVVVASPIGNLEDLSPRAAAALREADVVACEDTRRTATLLRHAGAETPMVPVHEHNEASRASDLARRMAAGETVALVSDAGMPGISDPGARVVAAAVAADVEVLVVPGPSAVQAALVASGFPTEPYAFVGFLPRTAAGRERLISRLDGLGTVVAFESPRRIGAFLAALAAVDPQRQVAVCRELTKVHEEVLRGPAADLADRLAGGVRGEVTVVIAPAPAGRGAAARDLTAPIGVLLDAGLSPARAAEVLSALGAAPRNAAYRAAVDLAAARRNAR